MRRTAPAKAQAAIGATFNAASATTVTKMSSDANALSGRKARCIANALAEPSCTAASPGSVRPWPGFSTGSASGPPLRISRPLKKSR